jgi:hypothetical protein
MVSNSLLPELDRVPAHEAILFTESIPCRGSRCGERDGQMKRARARRHGRSIGVADAQIAGIAASRRFSVATRDEEPF